MIPDSQTNFLYLANTLPERFPDFFSRLTAVLGQSDINHKLLPHTKDIWARDYMPVQISENRYVQFSYNPDYLQSRIWKHTISNVDEICEAIDLKPDKCDIVVDGGNIVKSENKVILCDKVFLENPGYERSDLSKKLREVMDVDQLIFVPRQPGDFTGHADGMVRFLDHDTVLINGFGKRQANFQKAFKTALDKAGLDYIEITYHPDNNRKASQANGIYINFLQMKDAIILPTFGMPEDDLALKQFETLFPGYAIKPLESNGIADEGGILNCIAWNIKFAR